MFRKKNGLYSICLCVIDREPLLRRIMVLCQSVSVKTEKHGLNFHNGDRQNQTLSSPLNFRSLLRVLAHLIFISKEKLHWPLVLSMLTLMIKFKHFYKSFVFWNLSGLHLSQLAITPFSPRWWVTAGLFLKTRDRLIWTLDCATPVLSDSLSRRPFPTYSMFLNLILLILLRVQRGTPSELSRRALT